MSSWHPAGSENVTNKSHLPIVYQCVTTLYKCLHNGRRTERREGGSKKQGRRERGKQRKKRRKRREKPEGENSSEDGYAI